MSATTTQAVFDTGAYLVSESPYRETVDSLHWTVAAYQWKLKGAGVGTIKVYGTAADESDLSDLDPVIEPLWKALPVQFAEQPTGGPEASNVLTVGCRAYSCLMFELMVSTDMEGFTLYASARSDGN